MGEKVPACLCTSEPTGMNPGTAESAQSGFQDDFEAMRLSLVETALLSHPLSGGTVDYWAHGVHAACHSKGSLNTYTRSLEALARRYYVARFRRTTAHKSDSQDRVKIGSMMPRFGSKYI